MFIFRNRRSQLVVGYTASIAGFFVLFFLFSSPKINSKKDLAFITGKLQSHSFFDGTRGFHDYKFKLHEYSNQFQIGADFLDFFDYYGFDVLDTNTKLTIGIFNGNLEKLSVADDGIGVYSIVDVDNGTNLLDYTMVIEKHNSLSPYFMSIALLVLGFVILYFSYKKTKQNTPKAWFY